MAKRPENMTPDERLARIRSLERKVNDLEHRLAWAEREREGTYEWAHSAFRENRRLTDRLRELIERIPSIIQPDIDRAVSLGRCEPCGELVDGTGGAE